MPPGYRPIVVDNGSRDGSADDRRARSARSSSHEPRARGSAPPAGRGCGAATAEVVCFMDCRRVARSARAAGCRRPGARRRADLVLGARRRRAAAPGRRMPGLANRAAGPRAAPAQRRAAHRPGADARGAAQRAAGPGHRRPPLRLAAGDGAARGGGRAGASTRSPSTYRPRVGRSKVTGTVRGTAARGRATWRGSLA